MVRAIVSANKLPVRESNPYYPPLGVLPLHQQANLVNVFTKLKEDAHFKRFVPILTDSNRTNPLDLFNSSFLLIIKWKINLIRFFDYLKRRGSYRT